MLQENGLLWQSSKNHQDTRQKNVEIGHQKKVNLYETIANEQYFSSFWEISINFLQWDVVKTSTWKNRKNRCSFSGRLKYASSFQSIEAQRLCSFQLFQGTKRIYY